MRHRVHGHLALLHALQQARLRLRRGAVDLVDQDHVGEDRAGTELEARLALVVDLGADDVGGQQVGRALHARELAVDRARQRARERGLADAGVVLDEDVALGEQRDGDVLEHVGANLDRPLDVSRDAVARRPPRCRSPPARGAQGRLPPGVPFSGEPLCCLMKSGSRRHRGSLRRSGPSTPSARAAPPSAVTMWTSLSAASNPIPAPLTSFTITASNFLRCSLSRPYSSAPDAVLGGEPDEQLTRRGGARKAWTTRR